MMGVPTQVVKAVDPEDDVVAGLVAGTRKRAVTVSVDGIRTD